MDGSFTAFGGGEPERQRSSAVELVRSARHGFLGVLLRNGKGVAGLQNLSKVGKVPAFLIGGVVDDAPFFDSTWSASVSLGTVVVEVIVNGVEAAEAFLIFDLIAAASGQDKDGGEGQGYRAHGLRP